MRYGSKKVFKFYLLCIGFGLRSGKILGHL
nr:MAG TPA: hypothetical protein [Caudoviricetes sp.]